MSKQALPGVRLNMFGLDPQTITIVDDAYNAAWRERHGDTNDHPLYDPRAAWPAQEELMLNVIRYGVKEPVLVTREGTDILIVDGRQRLKAVLAANVKLAAEGAETLTIRAIAEKGDEAELLGIMILSNELRRDDDILTKAAKAMRLLALKGGDYNAVATAFGVSTGAVRVWEQVNGLTAKTKRAVNEGKIGASVAVKAMNGLTPTEQNELLAQLLEQQPTGKRISGSTAKSVAQNGGAPNDASKRSLNKIIQHSLSLPDEAKTLFQWFLGQLSTAKAAETLPWLSDVVAEARMVVLADADPEAGFGNDDSDADIPSMVKTKHRARGGKGK